MSNSIIPCEDCTSSHIPNRNASFGKFSIDQDSTIQFNFIDQDNTYDWKLLFIKGDDKDSTIVEHVIELNQLNFSEVHSVELLSGKLILEVIANGSDYQTGMLKLRMSIYEQPEIDCSPCDSTAYDGYSSIECAIKNPAVILSENIIYTFNVTEQCKHVGINMNLVKNTGYTVEVADGTCIAFDDPISPTGINSTAFVSAIDSTNANFVCLPDSTNTSFDVIVTKINADTNLFFGKGFDGFNNGVSCEFFGSGDTLSIVVAIDNTSGDYSQELNSMIPYELIGKNNIPNFFDSTNILVSGVAIRPYFGLSVYPDHNLMLGVQLTEGYPSDNTFAQVPLYNKFKQFLSSKSSAFPVTFEIIVTSNIAEMYNLDSTDTTGNSTDDAIVLLNDIDLFVRYADTTSCNTPQSVSPIDSTTYTDSLQTLSIAEDAYRSIDFVSSSVYDNTASVITSNVCKFIKIDCTTVSGGSYAFNVVSGAALNSVKIIDDGGTGGVLGNFTAAASGKFSIILETTAASRTETIIQYIRTA